eukprot:11950713-Karenia_brevis.AAC.1
MLFFKILDSRRDLLDVRVLTQDMKSAYRQVPVADHHQRFSVVTVYHPIDKKWTFALLHALASGLFNAVLLYKRIPIHLMAAARRWLAIPVISFFDDFKMTDLQCAR